MGFLSTLSSRRALFSVYRVDCYSTLALGRALRRISPVSSRPIISGVIPSRYVPRHACMRVCMYVSSVGTIGAFVSPHPSSRDAGSLARISLSPPFPFIPSLSLSRFCTLSLFLSAWCVSLSVCFRLSVCLASLSSCSPSSFSSLSLSQRTTLSPSFPVTESSVRPAARSCCCCCCRREVPPDSDRHYRQSEFDRRSKWIVQRDTLPANRGSGSVFRRGSLVLAVRARSEQPLSFAKNLIQVSASRSLPRDLDGYFSISSRDVRHEIHGESARFSRDRNKGR